MIYTEIYTAPEWNERECLRYAGTTPQAVSAEERSLFEGCLKEVEKKLDTKLYGTIYHEEKNKTLKSKSCSSPLKRTECYLNPVQAHKGNLSRK